MNAVEIVGGPRDGEMVPQSGVTDQVVLSGVTYVIRTHAENGKSYALHPGFAKWVELNFR